MGPLVYAAFVDGSCLVWQSVCKETGSCLVYDIDLYRNRYIGVSLAAGAVAIVCTCPAFYFIRKAVRERAQGKNQE